MAQSAILGVFDPEMQVFMHFASLDHKPSSLSHFEHFVLFFAKLFSRGLSTSNMSFFFIIF